MCLRYSHSPHKRGNVVCEKLSRVGTFRFVRFASSPEVERYAGEVLGVFRYLKSVTGVVGGQVRNENEGLATNLHDLGVRDKEMQAILRQEHVSSTQRSYIKTVPRVVTYAMKQLEARIARAADVQQVAVN